MTIPIETGQGQYAPSKWMHLAFFLHPSEIAKVFEAWSDLFFVSLNNPLHKEEIFSGLKELISAYQIQLEAFLKGTFEKPLKKVLPLALSLDLSAFSMKTLPDERVLINIRKPVVLLRPHFISLETIEQNKEEKKPLFLGLHCSYPLIYVNPETEEIKEGMKAQNAALLLHIRKWLRGHTDWITKKKHGKMPLRISKKMQQILMKSPVTAKLFSES
jgi:hypothetical protein